jgi:MFS family permease
MLALTLAALDQNIVATALPRITGEFGSLQHLSWVVTSFILASTVSAPLYGKLSDLYGRKPAFIVSISIFLIGSALCGFAASMGQLIAFRTVQGLGAGGLIVLAQTVIGDLVSPRERGRRQGMFAAVFAACSVAGPLLGGIITEYASWRWIFYVNLPVGGAALAFIAIGLRPKSLDAAPRLDLLGAILLTSSVCSLLLALSWGGSAYAWFSAPVLGLGLAAIGSFMALAVVERRAAQPILPPELFGNSVFVVGRFTEADALTISRTAGPFRRRTLENITVHGANRNAPNASRPHSLSMPIRGRRRGPCGAYLSLIVSRGAAIATARSTPTSVASPRNQRYLSSVWPKRPGAFFLPEWQNPGELAHELNCEFPFLRHEPDRLDRRTQYLGGLRAQLLLIERLRQLLDFAPVDVSRAGVQHRRLCKGLLR